MKQIFIKIKREDDYSIDKDIKDSTCKERMDWYNTLSKGQIMSVLEKVGEFDK